MSGALAAEIVTDPVRLAALEPVWWELWRRCPAATPFATPAWLVPWWSTFAPGRLATVAVHAGGTLAGLAPLYLEDGVHGRRLLPLGIGVSDHLDILLDPARAREAGPVLARSLAAMPGWDSLELEEHAPDAYVAALPLPDGCTERAEPQSACPVLAIPVGRNGDPLDCVPARQRRKIRMAQHRTARRGGTVTAVAGDGLPAFMDALGRLHMARQDERGETGVFGDPRVLAFQSAALARLATADLLDAFLLRIDGQEAGAYLGFRSSGRAYAYLGGFDAAFAFESPGTVLLSHALEDATRRGLTEFHFLRGQESYKYSWGAVDRWNGRRSIRRPEAT